MTVVLDTPTQIGRFRLFVLDSRMNLEIRTGMRFKGRPTTAIVRDEFHYLFPSDRVFSKVTVQRTFEQYLKWVLKYDAPTTARGHFCMCPPDLTLTPAS